MTTSPSSDTRPVEGLCELLQRLGSDVLIRDLGVTSGELSDYLAGRYPVPDSVARRVARVTAVLHSGAMTAGLYPDATPVALLTGDEALGAALRRYGEILQTLDGLRLALERLEGQHLSAVGRMARERDLMFGEQALLGLAEPVTGSYPNFDLPTWDTYLSVRRLAVEASEDLRSCAADLRLAGFGALLPVLAHPPERSAAGVPVAVASLGRTRRSLVERVASRLRFR